ncbi:unnamed protein product [Gulo gulo]|uniref:Uncharacterized protein n=1 Tax=Gulo gulo TaxID=48420 RepID=A0A9X9LX07_GULGU|nr:unnamed protein product [Gulo gulo]
MGRVLPAETNTETLSRALKGPALVFSGSLESEMLRSLSMTCE